MLSKYRYVGWNGNVLGNKVHCNCDIQIYVGWLDLVSLVNSLNPEKRSSEHLRIFKEMERVF